MFRLSPTKHIKCIYCDTKGQSMVEESTSVLTFFGLFFFFMLTWSWGVTNSDHYGRLVYFTFVLFILFPILAGIFRIQTHSCRNCLNEVKQSSIFSNLDLDDNIVDIQISNFGMLIKRRTLLYSLIVIVVGALMVIVWDKKYGQPGSYMAFISDDYSSDVKPNYEVTYHRFHSAFSNRSSDAWGRSLIHQFDQKYKDQYVEWSGKVLRVDSFDSEHDDIEYSEEEGGKPRFYYCQILVRMDRRFGVDMR